MFFTKLYLEQELKRVDPDGEYTCIYNINYSLLYNILNNLMAANEWRRNLPLHFPYVGGCQTQVATQIRANGDLK